MSQTPHDNATGPLLKLENLTRFYGTVIGVNDITVELPRGAYGLVGPNGAGKSTLIGLITGILAPSLGRISVFGSDPRSNKSVLRRIGVCPASDVLLPRVSSREWIALLLSLNGWAPGPARKRTMEVLELVGLADAADRPIGSYSLGMRQRCKLAQALAHDPELLILDEPFNGLDPIGRFEMTALLQKWARSGRSLVLASHVLHEVEAVTDAFLLIFGGRLLALGSAGELRSMLNDLPQEVVIEGVDLRRLAARLAEQTWVDHIQLHPSANTLHVNVRESVVFYNSLTQWVAQENYQITGMYGSDGDLSTLFRQLVQRHRGQNQDKTHSHQHRSTISAIR